MPLPPVLPAVSEIILNVQLLDQDHEDNGQRRRQRHADGSDPGGGEDLRHDCEHRRQGYCPLLDERCQHIILDGLHAEVQQKDPESGVSALWFEGDQKSGDRRYGRTDIRDEAKETPTGRA
jgi:hypothetical protein